jgi:AcrR family transcriptional regulator
VVIAKDKDEPSKTKREQLLNVAIEVFSEQGFRATSMWDLARAMNLSKPALYHYVVSKEALLVELYDRVTAESNESVRSLIDRADIDPLEAFRLALVERVVYTCENTRLLKVFFENEAEIPKDLTRKLRRQQRSYEDGLIVLLNRATDAGRLQYSGSPRVVISTLLGAAHWTYKWYDPQGRLSSDQLADQMVELLLAGLLPRS